MKSYKHICIYISLAPLNTIVMYGGFQRGPHDGEKQKSRATILLIAVYPDLTSCIKRVLVPP